MCICGYPVNLAVHMAAYKNYVIVQFQGLLSDKRSMTVGKDRSNSIIQAIFRCKHSRAVAVQLCCVTFISPC